ncbi:ImmA/IrrE family metallo-endopeptidase [Brevibacterium casei]|uniref:ImmA/IrrE family metallo-endopeptidase n=1 Tax=Brevibacterium casei TaxID=33889 RepID=UPI00223C407B|nr:ImmA/IrrE family metallo-endopeptidase [Brevibacterium casei]MCT2182891.1 ImmA/IrrE family metallo-endopeptidase [Brevibacterium casei]
MHHPWRELRDRGEGVVLHVTRFTDNRVAATDGSNAIWLDADLLQVERRCAIAHEQAHIDLGHRDCDDPREESAARRLAARKLVDWDDLVDAYRWASCMAEWADELWVTVEVLEDRLKYLHPHELALLRMVQAARHG